MSSSRSLSGLLRGQLAIVCATSAFMIAMNFKFLRGAARIDGNLDLRIVAWNITVAGDTTLSFLTNEENVSLMISKVDANELPISRANEPKMTLINGNLTGDCFPHNSHKWLEGNHLSNAYDRHPHPEYDQILGNPLEEILPRALSQTLCNGESTFRNPAWNGADRETLISDWESRLLYMALHHYHHAPAVKEALARQACSYTPKIIDFECPTAKFLVTHFEPIGLGASFRTAAVNSMLLGLATDRITIFIKDYENFTDRIQFNPWTFASCARHDFQCVYRPTTPCTITEEELRSAPVLPEMDARDLRRMGKYRNPAYASQRMIVVKPKIVPSTKWPTQDLIESKMHELVCKVVDSMRMSASAEKIEILEAAAARIANGTITPAPIGEYEYSSRYHKTHHAALAYLMRPNEYHQRLSDEIVRQLIPSNFDDHLSIGLPIRGSDKCSLETVCYDFEKFMNLMHLVRKDTLYSPTKVVSLILTTEDSKILIARKKFERNSSFPFQFIVNTNDTLQGNGNPNNFADQGDEVMLSSLVSLKLQLRANHVFGNCCSNFHLVLFDFIHVGCGAIPRMKPMCLQEYPDPEYHLCCKWTKSEFCDFQRAKRKKERQAERAEFYGAKQHEKANETSGSHQEDPRERLNRKEQFKKLRRLKRLSLQSGLS